jgi:nucleosome binding factor SPN SPT16 subunit
LEGHLNGFRFTAKKDKNNTLPPASRTVDIIYKNIKHAFFQPSNRYSTLIILHLRLISPIMINKAAHKDVQFYLEIEDGESLLDNRRRNQVM